MFHRNRTVHVYRNLERLFTSVGLGNQQTRQISTAPVCARIGGSSACSASTKGTKRRVFLLLCDRSAGERRYPEDSVTVNLDDTPIRQTPMPSANVQTKDPVELAVMSPEWPLRPKLS